MVKALRPRHALRAFLALLAVVALSACGGNDNVRPASALVQAPNGQPFDVTLQAYKSGQFLLNHATLSAVDLGSHFAYLKDQGKLPKTVLLTNSDESKIRKKHLQYLARMALDYGFAVYYEKKGELHQVVADVKNARALEDVDQPLPASDSQPIDSASDRY